MDYLYKKDNKAVISEFERYFGIENITYEFERENKSALEQRLLKLISIAEANVDKYPFLQKFFKPKMANLRKEKKMADLFAGCGEPFLLLEID